MSTNLLLLASAAALCGGLAQADGEKAPYRAVALLYSAQSPSTLVGTVNFTQGDGSDNVLVAGRISGLTPGYHGFHIHQRGNLAAACTLAKGHFNPEGVMHGGRKNNNRHVGDLGNVEADSTGVADFDFTDNRISLEPKTNSIIGRAVVVHVGEDDMGTTDHPQSTLTGNAGARYACGVVGIDSDNYNAASESTRVQVFTATALLMLARIFAP